MPKGLKGFQKGQKNPNLNYLENLKKGWLIRKQNLAKERQRRKDIGREKMRQAKLERPVKYWLGKNIPESAKEKLKKWIRENPDKCGHRFKGGGENPNWQGGTSFEPYNTDWTKTLRRSIRERDKYTCQLCGKKQGELVGRFKKLDVHHIDYNKKNCGPDNLVTLCRGCHLKTNFERGRWIDFFKSL